MKQFKKKKDFMDWFLKQEMEFSFMRDLADGSKHFVLDRPDTSVLKTQMKRQGEKIGPYQIKEDTLYVQIKYYNGAFISFDDVLYLTTSFWYGFFSQKLGIDTEKIFKDDNYTFF